MCQNFIQFRNEFLNLQKKRSDISNTVYANTKSEGIKSVKPLGWNQSGPRYKDNTIVVTKICTLADDIGKVVCDILESLLLCSNLQRKKKTAFDK
jgi:hypothetical protein